MGKLARWLRMMGFDSLFFEGSDDSQMVARALSDGRVLLTRDTEIMKRRLITSGRIKAILIDSEVPERQMQQLIDCLGLKQNLKPFTLCIECNQTLEERKSEEVKERVPPFVYKTQSQYMECPSCHRIYWRGTHWEAMSRKLEDMVQESNILNN